MTILQKANQKVAALLRPGKRKEGQEYRLTRYLLRREAEGGVLFFNTLTCELLLLTGERVEKQHAHLRAAAAHPRRGGGRPEQ